MKRLAAALLLCLIATSAIAFYQSRDSNYNISVVSGGGACTTATFARDGGPVGNNASLATVAAPAFTTTFCNDLVIAHIITNSTVTSVTDSQSHLTFTKHAAAASGGNDVEIWTAPLSGAALTGDIISVNVASAAFTTIYVNAFSGYKTAAPFDPNAAIPNTQNTAVSCTWTTTNANDILIGAAVSNLSLPDAGWTVLSDASNSGWFDFGEFQSVSATQAGLTAATITGSGGGCIATAIQKGP